MSDSVDELIPLFKGLGITEYEAKVYLSLLSSHPASAYTISQHSDVPHSRVYDVTRRLIKRGMVAPTGKKPEMFSPLSPDMLIDKLQKEYQHYTAELERRLKEIDFHSDFDPVWNLTEPEEVLETTAHILQEARATVYIGLWDQELVHIRHHLEEAHQRNVKIFVLLYGEEELDFGTVYHHDTDNMPMSEEMGRSMDCTVDGRWCITGRFGGSHPCRVVWTQNPGLVQAIESYIRHDLYLAEITGGFKGEIERRYGKNLLVLREKFLG